MDEERFVLWEGVGAQRWEVAHIRLSPGGVATRGTQVGVDPLPYRLDYRLDATAGFVTKTLEMRSSGEGWQRTLSLEHNGHGVWHAGMTSDGVSLLPPPGCDTQGLEDARDCDIGFSPMTNLMPVRRYQLTEQPGSAEIVVAWIEVPSLILQPYLQAYDHVRRTEQGAIVRFRDLGPAYGFTADLDLDRSGIVESYPMLARRVHQAADMPDATL